MVPLSLHCGPQESGLFGPFGWAPLADRGKQGRRDERAGEERCGAERLLWMLRWRAEIAGNPSGVTGITENTSFLWRNRDSPSRGRASGVFTQEWKRPSSESEPGNPGGVFGDARRSCSAVPA